MTLLAGSALAGSFVVPTDDELVRKSAAIAIGTVEGAFAREGNGTIETVYEIRVERTLKGPVKAAELLQLTTLGGVIGDRGVLVPGEARFRQGERVLLFLDRDGRGRWRTTDLTLGRFEFVTSTKGEKLLVRDMEDVVGWDHAGRVHKEKVRKESGFLRFIEERARGRAAATDYVVDAAEVTLAPEPEERFEVSANATSYPAASYTDWVSSQPTRWPNATSIPFHKRSETNISGAADGGVSVIQGGLAAWTNEPGSFVNLFYNGQLPNKPSANHDATNVVEFNDPQGRITGSWGGSGTIGICFLSFAGTHPFLGAQWLNITDADVVFQDGYPATNAAFSAAMTHELGHGLGWRHSNQNHATGGACNSAVEECTSAAIMNSSVSASYGFTLQPWDVNAAQSVYPGATCTPATITTQPTSRTITSGSSTTLTVTGSGSPTLEYQWYTITSTTVTPIAGATGSSLTVSPASTTSYRVRVSNPCGFVDSVTVTVTVTSGPACTAPAITAQPTSRTITAGASTTLSVSATGTSPSYQWYIGSSGNTASPVAGGTGTSLTVAPSSTTSYWVRVSNSCGTVDSATATVTVTPACTAPVITSHPHSPTITAGSSTTLSVSATGTSLSYQWYIGFAGNTASPISGANSSSITVTPPSSTNYWVRVSNSCGVANSATAYVTVTNPPPACTPPDVISHPPSRSMMRGSETTLSVASNGTAPLSYQWYVGTSGTTSSPISGATGSFVTVSPTTTTSYWVRVTNSCGTDNSNTVTVTVTEPPPPPVTPDPRADFDGDVRSELLLRNSANQLAMWDFTGRTITNSANFATVSSSAWRIEGFGDFNGDGRDDILYRNTGSTAVAMWLLNGRSIISQPLVGNLPSMAWNFEAFGDVNGDGRTDALARNSSTGQVALWEFNGTTVVSSGIILTVSDLNWRMQGTGDFNNDGDDEVIWRNMSTQQMAMWEFSGRSMVNGGVFATAPGTAWEVRGIGDFDADGMADILWQNTATLDVNVWDMSYRTVTANRFVVRVGAAAWRVDAIGDYDGDGGDEVMWFNTSTRQLAMWELSSTHALVNGGVVATVPGDYRIQPPFTPTR